MKLKKKIKSRTEYSILNIFTGIGGYLVNTIMGLICRMVFTRCLSADYLGANGLFTNVISMLSLAELGIGNAIVYELYKPIAEHDTEKIASLVKLYGKAYRTIGLIVATIGMALMPFLNVIIVKRPNIQESIYLLYAINLFNTASSYFFSYKSSLIIAAQQNYIVTSVNYFITILQSVFQIIFLLVTHNYLVYLLIQTVGTLSYNVIISNIANKRFPYIKKRDIRPLKKFETKRLFRNVRDLFIYKISGLLVNSTDNILITFFKGLATTGIASNYTLLVNTLNSLLGQIFNGLTASVGNLNAIEKGEKKYSMFEFLHLMNFWLFGWCALGIIFCSSDLVKLLFGTGYVLSPKIPLVLALNFYTVGMQNTVWMYKNTMGLFHYGRFLQFLTGIINIILSILLGMVWGLFGILFATFISRLCTNLWYDPYAVYKYGFHKKAAEYFKKYIFYLFVLAIAGLLCALVCNLIHIDKLIILVLVKIILCSFICNGVFLLFFYRTTEFKMLNKIVNNLKVAIRRK